MFTSPAYAQAAGAAAPDGMSAFFVQMMPLLLIFVVFWFLIFRPQQQRAKDQRAKLEAVKKGDQVVTGGGLMGKVTKVDADTVEVEIAPNVRVKAVKATLADVVTNTPGKAAND
ncbi:preprotein translocase subunit YajC [Sphingomonas sp. SUN039]|uniref:preprotein translocase subunit YajC n=1 Tax=Sphingomonas sp. SUN039 TaxID=2937787 RepID=UPI002164111E|nr:preprotein translocase subunit YajC [Sphingomonas sp. SUN039]UVO52759.1 preprotein translocase subunit YajC [Sphingomonas sp. SUN039]